MKAMHIDRICNVREDSQPLSKVDIPVPEPASGEVLLKVLACGVCHTELDEIEGRTAPPELPVVPGHEVVGRVVEKGDAVTGLTEGQRVGVGWFYSSCGDCSYCRSGNENLCGDFRATGRDADGGYAEYMTVPAVAAFPVPDYLENAQAAPLLCAGAIGFRSLNLTRMKNGDNLGLTGFGGSAHLVLKMVGYRFPDSSVYVFARNENEREFALELGAVWAGDTAEESPEKLRSIIDTTPVWKPVVEAMKNLAPGGRLVVNAIRKENVDREYLLNLDYAEHLWMEREIKSVANVSPEDIGGFLKLAGEMKVRPEITEYPIEQANRALAELRRGNVRGAKVLAVSG